MYGIEWIKRWSTFQQHFKQLSHLAIFNATMSSEVINFSSQTEQLFMSCILTFIFSEYCVEELQCITNANTID